MKLSEYIRTLQEMLQEYGDAPMIFDDDTEFDTTHLPEFVQDPDGTFWVVPS